MRPAGMHLTPQELESLLFGAADSSDAIADGASANQAQRHLSGCTVCQSMADRYRNVDAKLNGLASRGTWAPKLLSRGTHCPAEGVWPRLAVGLIQGEEAEDYVTHAAECDWCGPLLKNSMEDLSQDLTVEEQEVLAKLSSASPQWQREMGHKMAEANEKAAFTAADAEGLASAKRSSVEKLASSLGWRSKIAWAGLGLAVMATAVWFTLLKTREADVNQLLAKAYTEQRTFELRMPGAKYGPMRVERGNERSRLAKPTSLLDAEAVIAHVLAKDPENAAVLQMRGRAELIEWNTEAAIETLKRALDLKPEFLSLKLDLATAYFERAAAKNRPLDYGTAIQLLGEVLAKNPDDPVALFNHAIACEEMFMYQQAMEDWGHYLQIDSAGGWAIEARQHLDRLRKKLGEHARLIAEPLLQPDLIARRVRLDDESTWDLLDNRVEEYLDLATRDWLPDLISPSSATHPRQSALALRSTLTELATILRRRHSDSWLAELMATAPSASFSKGLTYLSKAIQENLVGETDLARIDGQRAATLFQRAGLRAGFERAQLEVIYSWHRASQGKQCLDSIRVLAAEPRESFSWILAQSLLEKSLCSHLSGDLRSAARLVSEAKLITEKSHYPQLRLRALGFEASSQWLLKADPEAAAMDDWVGLGAFWNGVFPSLRSYNFYQDLTFPAESEHRNYLVYSLRREAAATDREMRDETRHAMAHFLLAKAAASAGKPREAATEFATAKIHLQRLEKTKSSEMYRLYCDISLAELKASQGSFESALGILQPREPELSSFSNSPVRADFYRALGNISLQAGNNRQAEKAFTSAIEIADAGLASLNDADDREAWAGTVTESFRGLMQIRLAADRPEDALAVWEAYRAYALRRSQKAGLGFVGSVKSTTSAGKLSVLPGESHITYAVVPDGVAIWAEHDRFLHFAFVRVEESELRKNARRFSEVCSNPKSDLISLKQTGARLYQWLIAPVEKYLGTTGILVIDPDPTLSQLPMQALVDGNGAFLASHFAVAYSQGRERQEQLREDAPIQSASRVLVVTPPSSTGTENGLLPLPDAGLEAELLVSEFSGARHLAGQEATWRRIRAELARVSVFHFAGHALASVGRTTLVVAGEGKSGTELVEASSFSSTDMSRLQLVVLSACSTGRVEGGLGDLGALVSVFARSGVPHVVATRWDVDSAAAADFVIAFYRALLRKTRVSAAVQAATTQIMSNPETEHPYYWAAFTAFGRS
jgi:CHAT domain-containing protein